jgi:acyl dehydratase
LPNQFELRATADRSLTVAARKLYAVIVQQAEHGPMRPKREGTAMPAEILEACGLDVGEFYELLNELRAAGLIRVSNEYPFEEIEISQRYFEDYIPGQVQEFGSVTVTEAEIIEFAKQFDPQYFHVDPVKAVKSHFGGLVASGWHTISLVMRLLVEHFITHVASLGSPGVEEVRWPNPLRPGDTLRVRTTILEARPSRSKPDRGIVRSRVEALNQKEQLVLTMTTISLFGRRRESGAAG